MRALSPNMNDKKWILPILIAALIAAAGYPIAKAHFDCATNAGEAARQVIRGDEKALERACADSLSYGEMVRRLTK